MYSMLQLKTKFLVHDGSSDEIPLPEQTCDGETTLNELTVKYLQLILCK